MPVLYREISKVLDLPPTGDSISGAMKTIRLLLSALIACAFLASGVMAHAGMGMDQGSHGAPVMVAAVDTGHDDHHGHGGQQGEHHIAGHGDTNCCVASGGCGFIVPSHSLTKTERIDFIVFEMTARSASSRASPPDFPPPRLLA